MQKTSIVAFRRGYRLQWEAAQESHVILYPEGMAKLNETAAAILELVDGRRDVAAIIAMLNERFPEAGGVDDDVIEFLQIACQQKWITCRESELTHRQSATVAAGGADLPLPAAVSLLFQSAGLRPAG